MVQITNRRNSDRSKIVFAFRNKFADEGVSINSLHVYDAVDSANEIITLAPLYVAC